MYYYFPQAITVTLALILTARYIFDKDHVPSMTRTSAGDSKNAEVTDGTIGDRRIHNGDLVKSGGTMNGDVPQDTSADGSLNNARKAFFQIGEGLSALVKSVTNDNVC